MSKKNFHIRFAIRRQGRRLSTEWTAFGHGADAYLAPKTLGGKMKYSLHGRSAWRFAFTKEFERTENYAELVGRRPRLVQEMSVKSGVSTPIRIIIPETELSETGHEVDQRTILVPPPEKGQCGFFGIITCERSNSILHIPRHIQGDITIILEKEMPNFLFVVAYGREPMDAKLAKRLAPEKVRLANLFRHELSGSRRGNNIRGLLGFNYVDDSIGQIELNLSEYATG